VMVMVQKSFLRLAEARAVSAARLRAARVD
jgi:hypothetical protein